MSTQDETALGRMIFYVRSVETGTQFIKDHRRRRRSLKGHATAFGYSLTASSRALWASYYCEQWRGGVQTLSRPNGDDDHIQTNHGFCALRYDVAFAVEAGKEEP